MKFTPQQADLFKKHLILQFPTYREKIEALSLQEHSKEIEALHTFAKSLTNKNNPEDLWNSLRQSELLMILYRYVVQYHLGTPRKGIFYHLRHGMYFLTIGIVFLLVVVMCYFNDDFQWAHSFLHYILGMLTVFLKQVITPVTNRFGFDGT